MSWITVCGWETIVKTHRPISNRYGGGQREVLSFWLQCSLHKMVSQLLLLKRVHLFILENLSLQRADTDILLRLQVTLLIQKDEGLRHQEHKVCFTCSRTVATVIQYQVYSQAIIHKGFISFTVS